MRRNSASGHGSFVPCFSPLVACVPGPPKVLGLVRDLDGSRTLVSVRRDQPAVLLRLSGGLFDRVLIGADTARAYVDQVEAARR